MKNPDFTVEGEQLRSNIEATAEFGKVDVESGHGRTVLTGSEANRKARDYFVNQLEAIGADVRVDAVGNIIGQWIPGNADPEAQPIVIGSHLDSVPRGGIFDGVLGVYAGVETVRALSDGDISLNRPIEIISFTEEEGARFGGGTLGSSVASGRIPVDEALAFTDEDGVSLETALDEIGYRGTDRLDARDWYAFFELHIEQAKRLERAGVPVGVVTTIAGVTQGRVEIHGRTDHAGTTAMTERSDALVAACEFVLALEEKTRELDDGEETIVGTVGQMDLSPGAINVIPGEVSISLDIRDVLQESVDQVFESMREKLDHLEATREVDTTLHTGFSRRPTDLSTHLREQVHNVGHQLNIETLDLHSGAFHDSLNIADVTEAALLFAPSRDGVSHSPLEWTDWMDIEAATAVLAEAVATVGSQKCSRMGS